MNRSESSSGSSCTGEAQALEALHRIAEAAGVILPDQVGFQEALAIIQARAGEDEGLLVKTCDLLLSARGKDR